MTISQKFRLYRYLGNQGVAHWNGDGQWATKHDGMADIYDHHEDMDMANEGDDNFMTAVCSLPFETLDSLQVQTIVAPMCSPSPFFPTRLGSEEVPPQTLGAPNAADAGAAREPR